MKVKESTILIVYKKIYGIIFSLCLGVFLYSNVYATQTSPLEEKSLSLSKNLKIASSSNKSYQHIVIQFTQHLPPKERKALSKEGVYFLHYGHHNRYIVYVDQEAFNHVKEHPNFEGAAFIPPTWKVHPELLEEEGTITPSQEQQSQVVDIHFFETTSKEQAKGILAKHDISVPQSNLEPDFNHVFQSIRIPIDKRNVIARENSISHITPPSPPLIPCNLDAQDTSNVDEIHPGGGAGFNLDGRGVSVALWDTGAVNVEHEQLQGRVIQKDNARSFNSHATHIAGTIAGSGKNNSQAEGMAPAANLLAFNMYDDLQEMIKYEEQYVISNHSYKSAAGWERNPKTQKHEWYGQSDPKGKSTYFGSYTHRSYQFDRILYQNNNLMVTSAGNDRQPFNDLPARLQAIYPQDGAIDEGYNTLTSIGVTKNAITVGAIHDLTKEPPRPVESTMTSYSSWGPTNDGRIKPDLVANGTSLLSAGADSPSSYYTMGGTSSSSPVIAGSLACLTQLYRREYQKSEPYAEVIKAIAIHTARDGGDTLGPNYRFGWGLLNARAAADFIQMEGYLGRHWDYQTYTDTPLTYRGEYVGYDPIKITLVWDDPPPYIYSYGEGSVSRLINDLDLSLEGPDGSHYPWTLDPERPAEPARQDRPNHIDNVEQVFIQKPQRGTYTIRIGGEVNLGENQPFALCISGIQLENKTPSISILHPLNIKPVSSTVKIKAQLRHPSQINQVRFYVDDQLLEEKTLFPPQSDTIQSTSWETSKWSNGSHRVKIEAFSMDGSINEEQREIVVFNQPENSPVLHPDDSPRLGYISTLGSTNEYLLEVPNTDTYRIETLPAFGNLPLDTILRLYRIENQKDTLITLNNDYNELGLSLIHAELDPEHSYRLEVTSDSLAKGFYQIDVNVLEDTPDPITPLEVDSRVENQSIHQEEELWYSFSPPGTEEYFIEATYEKPTAESGMRFPLQMELYDSLNNPSSLLSRNTMVTESKTSLLYAFEEGNEYYLWVKLASPQINSLDPFQLNVVQKDMADALQVERSIIPDEISLDASLFVRLKMKRNKEMPFSSVELRETVPDHVTIESVTPETQLRSNDRQIRWSLPHLVEEERIFQYQLTPTEPIQNQVQLDGELLYTIGKTYSKSFTRSIQGESIFSIVTQIPDWFYYR